MFVFSSVVRCGNIVLVFLCSLKVSKLLVWVMLWLIVIIGLLVVVIVCGKWKFDNIISEELIISMVL